MSDGGKGSSPRPFAVPKEEFDKGYTISFFHDKSDQAVTIKTFNIMAPGKIIGHYHAISPPNVTVQFENTNAGLGLYIEKNIQLF